MRKLALIVIGVVFLALPALAEDCAPVEVFSGYSFLSIDTKGVSSRQGANGWEAGLAMRLDKSLAVEFEGSGYYTTYASAAGISNVRDFYLLAGPRVGFKSIFVRALFGGDHLTDNTFSSSVFAHGFAGSIGGGVNRRVAGPWSIRTSVDYVFSRHSVFNSTPFTQNNFRTSVGLSYSFGRTPGDVY